MSEEYIKPYDYQRTDEELYGIIMKGLKIIEAKSKSWLSKPIQKELERYMIQRFIVRDEMRDEHFQKIAELEEKITNLRGQPYANHEVATFLFAIAHQESEGIFRIQRLWNSVKKIYEPTGRARGLWQFEGLNKGIHRVLINRHSQKLAKEICEDFLATKTKNYEWEKNPIEDRIEMIRKWMESPDNDEITVVFARLYMLSHRVVDEDIIPIVQKCVDEIVSETNPNIVSEVIKSNAAEAWDLYVDSWGPGTPKYCKWFGFHTDKCKNIGTRSECLEKDKRKIRESNWKKAVKIYNLYKHISIESY